MEICCASVLGGTWVERFWTAKGAFLLWPYLAWIFEMIGCPDIKFMDFYLPCNTVVAQSYVRLRSELENIWGASGLGLGIPSTDTYRHWWLAEWAVPFVVTHQFMKINISRLHVDIPGIQYTIVAFTNLGPRAFRGPRGCFHAAMRYWCTRKQARNHESEVTGDHTECGPQKPPG